MAERKFTLVHLLMGFLFGLFGILSSWPILKLLGGAAILLTALLAYSQWRVPRQDTDTLTLKTPELSVLERFFPLIFFTLTIAILIIMTLYTLTSLGLI